MKKHTKRELRAIERLVDGGLGQLGISWGPRRGGGMHLVIHDGEGSSCGYAACSLTSKHLANFADKFVRSLGRSALYVPAIRELIEQQKRPLRNTLCAVLRGDEREPDAVFYTGQLSWMQRTPIVPSYDPALAIVLVDERRAA